MTFLRRRPEIRKLTPTISTSAYAIGDCVGGLQTLSNVVRENGLAVFVHSLTMFDAAEQNTRLDVVFFDANPSASTFTDNDTLSIAAADQQKIIGTVPILDTDYLTMQGGKSVATVRNVGLILDVQEGSRDLYCALRAGGVGTYSATDDLKFSVGMLQG